MGILESVIDHVIDWDNFGIRAPYKKLGKALVKKVQTKIKQTKIGRLVTNSPDIQVREKGKKNG